MKCKRPNCKLTPWRGRLCYQHYREANGFAFDKGLGRFVKRDLGIGAAPVRSEGMPTRPTPSYSLPLERSGPAHEISAAS